MQPQGWMTSPRAGTGCPCQGSHSTQRPHTRAPQHTHHCRTPLLMLEAPCQTGNPQGVLHSHHSTPTRSRPRWRGSPGRVRVSRARAHRCLVICHRRVLAAVEQLGRKAALVMTRLAWVCDWGSLRGPLCTMAYGIVTLCWASLDTCALRVRCMSQDISCVYHQQFIVNSCNSTVVCLAG